MNKAHIELLKSEYESVVGDYCQAFCTKHGYEYCPDDWLGGDVGGIIEIGDMFINFDDIRTDVDNGIPEKVFSEWYWYGLRLHELGLPKSINLRSYAMGAPLPYSEEDLKRIEEAIRRVNEAEECLKKIIDEHHNSENEKQH